MTRIHSKTYFNNLFKQYIYMSIKTVVIKIIISLYHPFTQKYDLQEERVCVRLI